MEGVRGLPESAKGQRMDDKPPMVCIVSDSIGETAELVAKAAISQFNSQNVSLRRFSHVDDEQAVLEVLEQVDNDVPTIVVFTIVEPELRQLMLDEASQRGMAAIDLMGPMMRVLGDALQKEPKLKPGIIHRLDEEYFERVEAIEFAVRYDDGKDPQGLHKANLVLIGVSRTSKTPVSMYLAHRRYKVANVPLIPEIDLPDELLEIDRRKIVGLTIKPQKLYEIRLERLRSLGFQADASYCDMDRIREELAYARRVFNRLKCPVVDVSNKAVEETANNVLDILEKGVEIK